MQPAPTAIHLRIQAACVALHATPPTWGERVDIALDKIAVALESAAERLKEREDEICMLRRDLQRDVGVRI